MNWHNATRERPCPICHHTDWCTASDDGAVAVCRRVESPHPSKGGGWIHRLGDGTARIDPEILRRQREAREAARLAESERVARHFALLNAGPEQRRLCAHLAQELGVAAEALQALDVRWDREARAAAFPMRDAQGAVTGIRYRQLGTARKWSMRGSHDGLFLPRHEAVGKTTLVICEGASDTAAALTLGWRAVGRSSCLCGGRLLAELISARGIHRVAVFADNDPAGRRGATVLKNFLESSLRPRMSIIANIYGPPASFKDLRAWLAAKSEVPISEKIPLMSMGTASRTVGPQPFQTHTEKQP